MAELTFTQKVAKIQKELKAPKGQTNKFGGYKYRNCEDILEAVKPLLGDLILTVSDEVVEAGGRVYMKATSKISDGEGSSLSTSAFAREPDEQKGMSQSQLSGTASSYARKYSLNGLFLIDDTKDADTDEFQGTKKQDVAPTAQKTEAKIDVAATKAMGMSPDQKVIAANPENNVTKVDAPKKSGPWGKKAPVAKTDGDLY